MAVASGGAFEGEEEEGLVAAVEHFRNHNGSADTAAGVPLTNDGAAGGRESEAAGVEDFVAIEEERAAVQLIGAGLSDPVDDAV